MTCLLSTDDEKRLMTSEKISRCIKEAMNLTNDVSPDYRLEAFKIILVKLMEVELGLPNPITTATDLSSKITTSTLNSESTTLDNGEDEIPIITTVGNAQGNIEALFDMPWGQKRRKVKEIRAALDANNVPDDHLSQNLNRLTEKKKLRSFRQNGELIYWKNPDYGEAEEK